MIKPLKNLYTTWKDARRLRRIVKMLPERRFASKKIAFHTAKPDFNFLVKEGFLAHSLARLGATVYVILDDGIAPHWEQGKYDSDRHEKAGWNPLQQTSAARKALLQMRIRFILSGLSHPNLQIVKYSELLSRDLPEEVEESEIDHRKYALESTVRYFRSADLDFGNADTNQYLQMSEDNSRLCLKVGKAIYHVLKPDVYFCSHGFYSLWGAAYRYMQKKGVRSIVWNNHGVAFHIRLIADSYLMPLNASNEWKSFAGRQLTPEQQKWSEDYFTRRFSFDTRDTKIYYQNIDDSVSLDFRGYKGKVFCAFPNVSWDACITEKNVAFDGLLDWLKFTIRYFLEHPQQVLIIRFHPSEATMLKGSVKLQDILQRHVPEMLQAENIHLIGSERRIDTYQMIRQYVDVGLVYDGTLALELPYLKIPVIQAGRGVFNCEGIQTAAKTQQEYLEMLANPEKVIADFERDYPQIYQHLMKYSYWYYCDSGYFHPLRTGVVAEADTGRINYEEEPAFRRTLEKILGEAIPGS